MSSLPKALRGALPLVALLAAAGAASLLVRGTELMRGAELKTLDWRFRRLSDASRRDPNVVLVMVDQASLDHFEREGVYWPWPRSLYEAALGFLKAGGAKAVVFDLLFTSPSPYGQAEDEAFGAALKKFGNAALAMETGASPQPGRPAAPPERFGIVWTARDDAAPARASVRAPVAPILSGARYVGDTKVDADFDGVFRRVPLAVRMGGRLYPTLPAAAAIAATGKSLDELSPPLEDGRMLVRFHGRANAPDHDRRTYALYQIGDLILAWNDVLEKKKPALDPAVFKDKVVFVGGSAAGLLDNRPSPVSAVFPGTEIIAAAADNLINGDHLVSAPGWAVVLLVALSLLAAGLASRLADEAWRALAVVFAAAAVLAGASCWAFTRGVWLDMTAPQLSLWLGFAAASAYGYAVEGRQKRYIQGAFSFYLSPEVVSQIAESPEKLALGGERRDATFYFSDIQGFTSFSEKLGPEKLTQLMNRYLGEMTDTVLQSGGTLDKYIGDAIMAFWNAPLPCEGHELIACKVALANQMRLAALKPEFDRLGYPPVKNRIGLNTGPAIIGNMGSPKRFSYTAIGDAVNLASRLEGANKAYGSYILISETTRVGAGDAIEVRELDYVKVKGKAQPIRVYELLGLKGETDKALLEKARLFEAGLEPFRARRFAEALEKFRVLGDDYAAKKYVERCEDYIKEPPPSDWDGSNELTEK